MAMDAPPQSTVHPTRRPRDRSCLFAITFLPGSGFGLPPLLPDKIDDRKCNESLSRNLKIVELLLIRMKNELLTSHIGSSNIQLKIRTVPEYDTESRIEMRTALRCYNKRAGVAALLALFSQYR